MAVSRIGSEFQINADGSDASIAAHQNGSFLVTWSGTVFPSPEPDEPGPRYYEEVLGRAFASGSPLGQAFVVNTELRDPQFSPDVAARDDGSYVVAYSSGTEDQLPNTFVAHQIIGESGAKIGAEIYSPDDTYYHNATAVAAFTDGGYVIVSSDEFNGDGYVYAPDGSLSSTFGFGYAGTERPSAVTAINANDFLVVWSGYDVDLGYVEGDHGPLGLYGQVRSRDGSIGFPFLIAELDGPSVPAVDPAVSLLPNGNVVVVWTAPSSEGFGREIFSVVLDPRTGQGQLPSILSGNKPGDQLSPDVAVLSDGRYVVVWEDDAGSALGDADGSAIVGRVFNNDGTFDQSLFLANTATVGSQAAPSVAALADDFAVVWQGPDGIKGQVFAADALSVPDKHGRPHKAFDVSLTFVSEESGFDLVLTALVDDTVVVTLPEGPGTVSFVYTTKQDAHLQLQMPPALDSRVNYYADDGDGLFDPISDRLIFSNVQSSSVPLNELRKASHGSLVFGGFEDRQPGDSDDDFNDYVVAVDFQRMKFNAGGGNGGEPPSLDESKDIDPGNSGAHNHAGDYWIV